MHDKHRCLQLKEIRKDEWWKYNGHYVENNDGNAVRSGAILTVSDAPAWTTGAGSLGTIAGDFSGTAAFATKPCTSVFWNGYHLLLQLHMGAENCL